jgi:glycerate 2-kinase
MHVLAAPDKFKGSLTAREVAERIAAGIAAETPQVPVVLAPVADGGDGTVDAALAAGFERVQVRAEGPTGEPVDTAFAVREGVAVVEMADVSGLRRLPDGRLAALEASSYGTGEVVQAALEHGCQTIVLGIGGSASTDGGAGMVQALGGRLLDSAGDELPHGGGALARLAEVDLAGLDPRLAKTRLIVASDVDNPLTGPRGAAAVYGPQKGASPEDVEFLDAALSRWANLVAASTPPGESAGDAVHELPGAGAAGGVGFGAMAVLGAELQPGIDLILDLLGFHEKLQGARLVITGEGSLDEQTLSGKAPQGVAAAAAAVNVPVVAVCGRSLLTVDQLRGASIQQAYALTDIEPDLQRCLTEAGPLLEQRARALARDWLLRPTGGDMTSVPLFVNGGGMRGGEVHYSIEGLPFLGEARTAPRYRFFSVRDEFPGLWLVDEGGVSIAGELYDVPLDVIRDRFIPAEPPELELGVVELDDGSSALVVVVRASVYASGEGLKDISEYGGWRAYRASVSR